MFEASSHILDRAANRIAAVKCALRTTQHLNTFDIIQIEYRRVRAVEINIINVQANTGFITRNRILLSDAANE